MQTNINLSALNIYQYEVIAENKSGISCIKSSL